MAVGSKCGPLTTRRGRKKRYLALWNITSVEKLDLGRVSIPRRNRYIFCRGGIPRGERKDAKGAKFSEDILTADQNCEARIEHSAKHLGSKPQIKAAEKLSQGGRNSCEAIAKGDRLLFRAPRIEGPISLALAGVGFLWRKRYPLFSAGSGIA